MTGKPDPFRKALVEKLEGDATLTALLSAPDAIYHRDAPEDAKTPYVIVNKQAATRQWAMHGSALRWPVWLVKGVSRSESSNVADAIDTRIDELLSDAELNVEGFSHLYLRRDSDVDYGQPDSGGLIHHVGGLYRAAIEPT